MGEVINVLNELTDGRCDNCYRCWSAPDGGLPLCKVQSDRKVILLQVVWARWALHLPAAIGAKFGAPDRTVVAIIGDGGFQMTMQELGTIMQSEVNVKILILNNQFLGNGAPMAAIVS